MSRQPSAIEIINVDALEPRCFEGADHGGVAISFFPVDSPPGAGPGLHVHPYDEVFVVVEGEVVITVAGVPIEAKAGQIVIGPAGQSHKFVVTGPGRARLINIHPSPRVVQDWLEE
jgi:mannose-6-phosphate isomerase-like protein (cupin superfamily)